MKHLSFVDQNLVTSTAKAIANDLPHRSAPKMSAAQVQEVQRKSRAALFEKGDHFPAHLSEAQALEYLITNTPVRRFWDAVKPSESNHVAEAQQFTMSIDPQTPQKVTALAFSGFGKVFVDGGTIGEVKQDSFPIGRATYAVDTKIRTGKIKLGVSAGFPTPEDFNYLKQEIENYAFSGQAPDPTWVRMTRAAYNKQARYMELPGEAVEAFAYGYPLFIESIRTHHQPFGQPRKVGMLTLAGIPGCWDSTMFEKCDPPPPAHQNCRCVPKPVPVPELEKVNLKFSPVSSEEAARKMFKPSLWTFRDDKKGML